MNQVIEQLIGRKSVRVFTEQLISDEDKNLIIRAATEAPTAGNQQLYTILDITDRELIDKLIVTCDNQPFIGTAKMILIFCADVQRWHDIFIEGGANPRKPGLGDLLLAVSDANIAAQNAVVAAESLGIGSCYIGDIMENCELHRQMLNLPEYVFPACMLVFGYPTEQQKNRLKPKRCKLEHIVQENTYKRRDGEELRYMMEKECISLSYEEWSKRFCNRKFNSDFSVEMSRSVEMYLDSYHSYN